MSLSEMSIWVRDTEHPCLPYRSTRHDWVAIILTCNLRPLSYGVVHNGVFPLTESGAARGRVHGQVRVPPGCYIVLAVATCKNIYTDMAFVQVGCDETVCVNLITKRLSTCAGQLIAALNIAAILGPAYSPSSPPGEEIPREVIAKVTDALEELRRHLPPDPVLPALPISVEDLGRMAGEVRQGREPA